MLPEVNACRLSYVSVFRGCSPVVQGSKILFKVPWSVARGFLGWQPNFNSLSWRWRRRRKISPKHRHNESPDLSSTSHKVFTKYLSDTEYKLNPNQIGLTNVLRLQGTPYDTLWRLRKAAWISLYNCIVHVQKHPLSVWIFDDYSKRELTELQK